MDIYRALIGEPPTEEEKLAALAAQLRMRNNQGFLGQLSGVPQMQSAGKELTDAADTQAQQLGVRGETARYRKYQEEQSAASLAQRRAEQLASEEQFKKTYGLDAARLGLERARLAQARELAAERIKSVEKLAALKENNKSTGLKLSSKAAQDAQSAERLADKAIDLKGGMPNSAVDRGKDIAVDLASAVRPAIGQYTASLLYGDDENKWRSDADSFDQDLSNLAAGLAVTGFELENKQKWSPRAPGITRQQAQDRFDNIERKFRDKARYARGENAAYQAAYGGGAVAEEDPIDAEIRRLEEEIAAMGGP